MGDPGARRSPVMEAPFLREGTTIRVLSDAPSRFFFRRDGISIRPYRCTLPPKMTKKNDDLHFKRFFQCFSFLSDVPSSKKRRKILINVPFVRFSLFTYPPGRFFRNYVFLRGPSAETGGNRYTLPPKITKKMTIFILNDFFNVFRSFFMYILAKKAGNFLSMYPLFVFPY